MRGLRGPQMYQTSQSFGLYITWTEQYGKQYLLLGVSSRRVCTMHSNVPTVLHAGVLYSSRAVRQSEGFYQLLSASIPKTRTPLLF